MSNINQYRIYFNESRYTNWYFNIIEKARSENRRKLKRDDKNFIYYERHHIVPKSIDKSLSNLQDNPNNSVLLTAREHIFVHWLLCYMVNEKGSKRNSLLRAFHSMCFQNNGGKNKRTPSIYQLALAREKAREANYGNIRGMTVPDWYEESKELEKFKAYIQKLLIEEDLSDFEAAQKCGVSNTAIHNWRKKFKIKTKRNTTLQNKEWLYNKYINEKLSCDEIGKSIGCTGTAVWQYLNKFKIPVRNSQQRQQNRRNKPIRSEKGQYVLQIPRDSPYPTSS